MSCFVCVFMFLDCTVGFDTRWSRGSVIGLFIVNGHHLSFGMTKHSMDTAIFKRKGSFGKKNRPIQQCCPFRRHSNHFINTATIPTDFIASRTNSNQAHTEPLFYFLQMKSQSPPPQSTIQCYRLVPLSLVILRRGRGSSISVHYLINVWVPVLVVLGLGCCAVDSGEEGGLGEVHLSWVQAKRLSNNCLDSPTYIS